MGEKGFTLMELLIVIVILGFLIGMIAPRLSSIIDDTVIDNICDSNNKGMRTYVNMFLQKKSRLPNDMINLVNVDTATSTYVIPTTSDGDSTNGPESFAEDFVDRNDPTLYALSAAEVAEIKSNFGISHVRNLNQELKELDAFDAPYERVELAAAVSVAMIGASETDAALNIPVSMADATVGGYPVGNPDWLGRIILGIGKHSELVTGGYIQAAALCPGGIQNADNVAYNSYCLILPRLDATLDIVGNALVGDLKGVELTFIDADGSYETMLFTMEAQEAWQFEFTCPEGHKWPDNDNDNWVYDSGL